MPPRGVKGFEQQLKDRLKTKFKNLRTAFRRYDKDFSGTIDRVEARHLCEEFGLDSKLVLDYLLGNSSEIVFNDFAKAIQAAETISVSNTTGTFAELSLNNDAGASSPSSAQPQPSQKPLAGGVGASGILLTGRQVATARGSARVASQAAAAIDGKTSTSTTAGGNAMYNYLGNPNQRVPQLPFPQEMNVPRKRPAKKSVASHLVEGPRPVVHPSEMRKFNHSSLYKSQYVPLTSTAANAPAGVPSGVHTSFTLDHPDEFMYKQQQLLSQQPQQKNRPSTAGGIAAALHSGRGGGQPQYSQREMQAMYNNAGQGQFIAAASQGDYGLYLDQPKISSVRRKTKAKRTPGSSHKKSMRRSASAASFHTGTAGRLRTPSRTPSRKQRTPHSHKKPSTRKWQSQLTQQLNSSRDSKNPGMLQAYMNDALARPQSRAGQYLRSAIGKQQDFVVVDGNGRRKGRFVFVNDGDAAPGGGKRRGGGQKGRGRLPGMTRSGSRNNIKLTGHIPGYTGHVPTKNRRIGTSYGLITKEITSNSRGGRYVGSAPFQ